MRTALFLFVAFLMFACTQPLNQTKDPVFAKVNGQPLFLRYFLTNFSQLKAEQDEISLKNPKLLEQLKTRALNETIITILIRQEGAKRRVKIDKEEVVGRLANWKDGYPPGGFEEMLRKQNITEDFLKMRIEEQLLIEKLSASLSGQETLISEEQMRKHYKLHEKEFFQPEQVHVLQIVVPTKEESEKIRQEILTGKLTFESAARQYSLSPDATKGGDLGFFARNEKIEAFNEAFSQPVGAISKPVQSRYGLHLLKVIEKQPAKKLSFEETKNDIYKNLKKQNEARVYKEWVTKLLKDAEIYRNEALFASIG